MKQSRRKFLGFAAAGATGIATGTWILARDWVRDDDPLEQLTGVAAGSPEFLAIGKRYLEIHPGEADRAVLLRALGFAGGERDPSTREELLEIVHAGILRDVANDDTVQLRAWIFSRTECRLFALGSVDA